MNIKTHYDLLIEENNDPFRDPPALRQHMESWDGQVFLDLLELAPSKMVLEIGIGTGRLAEKTAGCCSHLTGIDISPKTIRRARENLRHCQNITLICDDFTTHVFREKYDVIYSTLTMMHFQDKSLVIGKISALLNDGGLICLSIDKNQSEWLDMGNRRIRIYPDTPERIMALAEQVGLKTKKGCRDRKRPHRCVGEVMYPGSCRQIPVCIKGYSGIVEEEQDKYVRDS